MSLSQSKLVIIISTFNINGNLYLTQNLHMERGLGEFENDNFILMNIAGCTYQYYAISKSSDTFVAQWSKSISVDHSALFNNEILML